MSGYAKYAPPALGNLPFVYQGKTRDTFEAQWFDPIIKERPPLLIVASDRISTHDVVHKSTIPYKGEVLTALTIFWFAWVMKSAQIPRHLISFGKNVYDYLPGGKRGGYPANLHHRAIVVKQLDIIPVEFIFRVYLAGSLWDKYYRKGNPNPYGIELPMGLPLMYKFEEPIFTPTVKSDTDPPLPSEVTAERHAGALALCRRALSIGRHHMSLQGLEIVDTKFEVGVDEDGVLMLADEVLTPDSSRFVRKSDIAEGRIPPWLDKQLARDKAEEMWGGRSKVPLEFPPQTVARLSQAYLDLFEQIAEIPLSRFQKERML